MKLVKIIEAVQTISAILCCLFLIWNESAVSCDIITCKLLETMFLIVAFVSYSIYRDISWNNIGTNMDK